MGQMFYGGTGRYVATVHDIVGGTGRRDHFFDGGVSVPSRPPVTANTSPPTYGGKPWMMPLYGRPTVQQHRTSNTTGYGTRLYHERQADNYYNIAGTQ